jgi:hypothetical protein
MQSLLLYVLLPLMAASLLYLLILIPVEVLHRRFATVRFKRILFLGLVTLAYVGLLGSGALSGLRPSHSPEVVEGAKWSVRCEPLVDAYQACYGPGWSRDVRDRSGAPTHYVVTVERNGPDGSLEVFGRELQLADVAGSLLEPEAQGIMRFDAAARAVTFDLGGQSIRYDLRRP